MKYTIGEICEKLDTLNSWIVKLDDNYSGLTLNYDECKAIAQLLSEYSESIITKKVDI